MHWTFTSTYIEEWVVKLEIGTVRHSWSSNFNKKYFDLSGFTSQPSVYNVLSYLTRQSRISLQSQVHCILHHCIVIFTRVTVSFPNWGDAQSVRAARRSMFTFWTPTTLTDVRDFSPISTFVHCDKVHDDALHTP